MFINVQNIYDTMDIALKHLHLKFKQPGTVPDMIYIYI